MISRPSSNPLWINRQIKKRPCESRCPTRICDVFPSINNGSRSISTLGENNKIFRCIIFDSVEDLDYADSLSLLSHLEIHIEVRHLESNFKMPTPY